MKTTIKIGNYRLQKIDSWRGMDELIPIGNPVMGHTEWKRKGFFPDPESALRGFTDLCSGTKGESALRDLVEGIKGM